MKLYNALVKKDNSGKIEEVLLLKDGFSFSAFCFSGLWFLYHRMWRELIALVIMHFALSFFSNLWSGFDKVLLEIAFLTIVALNANYWLVENLKRRKYEFVGAVFGNDEEDAALRFVGSTTTC